MKIKEYVNNESKSENKRKKEKGGKSVCGLSPCALGRSRFVLSFRPGCHTALFGISPLRGAVELGLSRSVSAVEGVERNRTGSNNFISDIYHANEKTMVWNINRWALPAWNVDNISPVQKIGGVDPKETSGRHSGHIKVNTFGCRSTPWEAPVRILPRPWMRN